MKDSSVRLNGNKKKWSHCTKRIYEGDLSRQALARDFAPEAARNKLFYGIKPPTFVSRHHKEKPGTISEKKRQKTFNGKHSNYEAVLSRLIFPAVYNKNNLPPPSCLFAVLKQSKLFLRSKL